MKELIGQSRTSEVKTIHGKRYRYFYEVSHYKTHVTRLSYKGERRIREGYHVARHGYPYKIVEGKGARFVSLNEAFEGTYSYYARTVSYMTFETKFLYRKELPEIEGIMIHKIYTIKNKSRGDSNRIRNLDATIEAYYSPDEKPNVYARLKAFVKNSDVSFLLANYDVEADSEEDVELDMTLLGTYECVLHDGDYHTVRARESGKL